METEMLPQPPPGVRAPAPGAAARRSRRWMTFIVRGGLASVVLTIAGAMIYVAGPRMHHCCHIDPTRATNNARQIGMALFEFDADYGAFPDTSTIAAVNAETATAVPLGDATSNDLFRQMFAAGIAQNEEMFYAKVPGSRKPDNDMTPGKLLAAGECGFAYVAGLSSSGDPKRPLAMTPMVPGTLRFDPKVFEGKAIILRCDNSVASYDIDRFGHVLDTSGMDILDPRQPYWKGTPPNVKWPDLLAITPAPPATKSSSAWIADTSIIGLMGWGVWKTITLFRRAGQPLELLPIKTRQRMRRRMHRERSVLNLPDEADGSW